MPAPRGLARLWSHLSWGAQRARRAFPDELLQRVGQAVADGERRHSAEIRVAIEAALPWHRVLRKLSSRERAVEVFSELRVWDTEGNNGVLLYLLLADHAIELVVDRAALAALGAPALDAVCQALGDALRQGRTDEGLLAAVGELNRLLAEVFPPLAAEAQVNELPDRPVRIGGR
ncbi:MAG: TPM domain-containing protein [Burkholderiaceae bacterium]